LRCLLRYFSRSGEGKAGNVEFQSFEEFWAALDRLELDIARMQKLQQETAQRWAENAKRADLVAPGQEHGTQDLYQIEATIEALGAMIAKLLARNAANDRRLRN
jgi:hypothetical protein